MTKISTITISTPSRPHRTFTAPRSPYPWVWRCHKCRTVYRFSAALNRCLSCSHRFCAKCISEFDYTGWEHWKSYWRVPEELVEDRGALWGTLEEGLQGELDDLTPDSSCSTSPTSSEGEGEEDEAWSPCLRESVELEVETRELVLAFRDEDIDPALRGQEEESGEGEWEGGTKVGKGERETKVEKGEGETRVGKGYGSVEEAREALYPGCAYGNGEEGETMRDWLGESVGG